MTPADRRTDTRSLEEADAIRTGHFVLTSGRHSGTYVQCARVLEDPALTTGSLKTAVERLPGGLGYRSWWLLPPSAGSSSGSPSPRRWGSSSSSASGSRGTWCSAGRSKCPQALACLVVEDVVTTGGSVGEVIDLVRFAGGEVVGVVSLIDRGGEKKFDAPFWPLLSLEVESWDADYVWPVRRRTSLSLAGKSSTLVIDAWHRRRSGVAWSSVCD